MAGQTTGPEAETWLAFPLYFVGVWALATIVLGVLSGWFSLQGWYADERNEPPLLKLGWQSGSMGFGVNFSNCLTLAATRRGLSVRMWRIFGFFQKPLLIPWSEIAATPKASFFYRSVRLDFGRPPRGSLRISEKTWDRLVAAAGPAASSAK